MNIQLVLIGAGHSNLLIIPKLSNFYSLKLTLITDCIYSYYSGMIPGAIAKQYEENEVRVDIERFCQKYKIRLIVDRVMKIDVNRKTLELQKLKQVNYDILSINIGSIPRSFSEIKGLDKYSIPTRPLSINSIQIKQGGAAGVEIAFCLHSRLKNKNGLQIIIVEKNYNILSHFSQNMRDTILKELNQCNIKILYNKIVQKVVPNKVIFDDGEQFQSDLLIWSAGAGAPVLFKQSDMKVDQHGFLLVKDTLQYIDDPFVFGSGDCIQMINFQHDQFPPKAGVYAVRQAPIVLNNIIKAYKGLKQQNAQIFDIYRPQQDFLKLISFGNSSKCIAIYKNTITINKENALLKNMIDRKFINSLKEDRQSILFRILENFFIILIAIIIQSQIIQNILEGILLPPFVDYLINLLNLIINRIIWINVKPKNLINQFYNGQNNQRKQYLYCFFNIQIIIQLLLFDFIKNIIEQISNSLLSPIIIILMVLDYLTYHIQLALFIWIKYILRVCLQIVLTL